MKLSTLAALVAATVLSQAVMADGIEEAPRRRPRYEEPRRYERPPQPRVEDEDEIDEGLYAEERMYNPRSQYLCRPGCAAPVLPFPVAPIVPYIPPPVIVGPPVVVRPPVWNPYPVRPPVALPYPGPRPGYGPYPGYGPRPVPRPYYGRPGYHRMSLSEGCEVQQGNNGEFAVLNNEGRVIFQDNSAKADANADYMKSYYEKNGFCGKAESQAVDI